MIDVLKLLMAFLYGLTRSQSRLEAENLALLQRLIVLSRKMSARPRLKTRDREPAQSNPSNGLADCIVSTFGYSFWQGQDTSMPVNVLKSLCNTGEENMFQQPMDFKEESDALYALLKDQSDSELSRLTQFNEWTIDNVIGHLHMWNWVADLSVRNEVGFLEFSKTFFEKTSSGSLRGFEDHWLDGLKGRELLETWRRFYLAMADDFSGEDPKRRVKWLGPDMSIRSSITARLMETWAHGQEVYDALGFVREDRDRIRNIAILGMNTFAWTFVNRGKELPGEAPHVRLTAPSGEIWEWNEANDDDLVEGLATEFCQVVAQTRNVADTSLKLTGTIAKQWMDIAQCFAGPPVQPPAPGLRHVVS